MDEMVRINAVHGALTPEAVVYQHIEVEVHPIRVCLTAALAAALQDYFQLKEEDSKARQQEYVKSIKPGMPRLHMSRETVCCSVCW
jgi:hypothetical protein